MEIQGMEQKIRKKVSCFLDNCVWIESDKFSQFRRGSLSLTVNLLTNAPKISNITKRNFFEISFP